MNRAVERRFPPAARTADFLPYDDWIAGARAVQAVH
jgi:hypothetical protein